MLDELHIKYPQYEMGRHMATAFADYGNMVDIWGLSGKEFLFALQKYQAELELDENNTAGEEFVKQILEDGMNLGKDKEDEWAEGADDWEE